MGALRQTDRLCGIERHPDSDARGELVAPIIFLWDRAGPLRRYVVAVAEHDTQIQIVDRWEHDDRHYFLVEPERAEWVGRIRRIRGFIQRCRPSGWVSEDFLLNYGK